MIVACASSAPTCLIHARNDELHMLEGTTLIPSQCDKYNSDPTLNDVWYKLLERCDDQSDRHNTLKHSDEIWKTDWCEDPALPKSYSGIQRKVL